VVAVVAWIAFAACAAPERTAPGDRPSPIDEQPTDSVVVEDDDSPEGMALAEAERAWLDGDYLAAAGRSDSLSRAWSRRPGVDERSVRRLVRLLLARAEDVEAVDQFLYHPTALDESWRDEMRAAVGRMSLDELDGLARRVSRDEQALGIVRAELAWALARSGDDERARELARDLDPDDLRDPERRKVEDVLAGRVEPAEARIRIGVVVPRSGGFEPVGDQLLEGARLAAGLYESETGVPVELVVVDESLAVDSTGRGFAAVAPGAFREPGYGDGEMGGDSEGDAGVEGAVGQRREPLTSGRAPDPDLAGVIGPITTDGLRAAAAARLVPGLLILSPTASDDSGLPPHAYSLWDRARRDSLESTTLANWMVSAFQSGRVGALYPDNESGRRRADAFREVSEGGAFEWVGGQAYHPDSTTHEAQIEALAGADPDFVYTIVDGPRQVLQIAPQLHFFGLRGRIILVSQDWTHPVVARRLDEPFSDYRVAAAYFDREGNPEWERFASAWDETYRRSMPESAFGALGYDAVWLILRAVPDPTLVRPAAVARILTRFSRARGATGEFSFDPEGRRLSRSARVWMILRSELNEPDPDAILEWSIETREQERERLEREAEEEARRRGGAP
jgi:ABC-type branched-subunit amino acid transport system substrate-binding protein